MPSANARQIISVERAMGLFHEETVQHWFLGWSWFMWFWNVFYGTFHFIVPIAVLLTCSTGFPIAIDNGATRSPPPLPWP